MRGLVLFFQACSALDGLGQIKKILISAPYFSNESLPEPKTSSEEECLCFRKKKRRKKKHSNIYQRIMKIVMILFGPSSYSFQAQMALNWLAKGARGLFFLSPSSF